MVSSILSRMKSARLAGLRQGLLHDLEGDALDLDVHLEGGDALGRVPATLKSMSPKASSMPAMSVSTWKRSSPLIRPMATPATGALMGTPRVHQGEGAAADAGHGGAAVAGEHLGDQADGVGELLLVGDDGQEGALGEGAVADVAAAGGRAWGAPRRRRRAGSCSGGGSACVSSGSMPSSRCCSPIEPSVAMVSTWVSPRVNRPEPWVRGSRPTSQLMGRISSVLRPSGRLPSFRMRRAHDRLHVLVKGGLECAFSG